MVRRGVMALVVAVATACASPALDYARARHPGCQVEPVGTQGAAVTVRITCPNSDPVERTYRGQ